MEQAGISKKERPYWKVFVILLLGAVVAFGLFSLFGQFDADLAQEYLIVHNGQHNIAYFEWDDAGNRRELTPEYGPNEFITAFKGSDFLDRWGQGVLDESGDIPFERHRIGFSFVLQEWIDYPYAMFIIFEETPCVVFLDEEIFYTDFPDEAASLENPPAGLDQSVPKTGGLLAQGSSFRFPQEYLGKTITVISYVSPEQAELWEPPAICINNPETDNINFMAAFGPNILKTGMLAALLILLFGIFAYQLWSGGRPWPLLLPIGFVLIRMISDSNYLMMYESSPARALIHYISALSQSCLPDLLLFYLATKLKTRGRYLLFILSGAHFLFEMGRLTRLYAAGEYLTYNSPFSGLIGIFAYLLAFVLIALEEKRNPYFKFFTLGALLFVTGFSALLLYYRFTDMGMFREIYPIVESIFMLNPFPLYKLFGNFMMVMVTVFSLSAFVSELVERRARVASLEQMNRLKTEFLGNVAHELKTPLAVSLGVVQNAKHTLERRDAEDELIPDMKLLASEIDRLGLMITQILDSTRIEENSMIWDLQACSVQEIIQYTKAAYYPLLKKNSNRLVIHPCGALPEVLADPNRISQVLVNLLQNSIRHTRNGTITIFAAEKDGYVEVSVADTGEGIEADRLPHIFERFKSHDSNQKARGRRDTGTGLGLYICKHIVENHGGTIWVESEMGVGTVVHFTIPVPPPAV